MTKQTDNPNRDNQTTSDRRPSFEELEKRAELRANRIDEQNELSLKDHLATTATERNRNEVMIDEMIFRHDLDARHEIREVERHQAYLGEVERNRTFSERYVVALERIAEALTGIRDQGNR